jgi:hypothetical protein
MIGAPLALLGLLAVVVPVIIHLFGRQQAKVLRFPTLRFISDRVVPPTSRRRITDLTLLIVRCLIVTLAALALARPIFSGRPKGSASGSADARVVIVDTSESVAILARLDTVRRMGDSVASLSPTHRVVQTDNPAAAIAGASEWLEKLGGRAELVVISDFTLSSVDSLDFGAVPRDVGIRLMTIPTSLPQIHDPPSDKVRVLASDRGVAWLKDRSDVVGVFSTTDSSNATTFIFSDYPARAALPIHPLDKSAQLSRTIERVLRDSLVRDAAARSSDTRLPNGVRPLIGNRVGISADGIWVNDSATSILGAALLNVMARGRDFDEREFDHRVYSPEQLKRWERPSTSRPISNDDSSDGRYIWIGVLLLLGLEAWMRRERRHDQARHHEQSRHHERSEGSAFPAADAESVA